MVLRSSGRPSQRTQHAGQLTLSSLVFEVTAPEKRQHHYLVPITRFVAVGMAGDVCVAVGISGLDEAETCRLAAEPT
jgi:hypothetical protein